MAQYIKPQDVQDGEQRYEVVMLAAGKDGSVVEATNPLPVTLGSGSVNITGPVSIPGSVEISNDTGNPVPVSANTSTNSSTNPIFVKGSSDTSFFAPTQSDAFGRLRVSDPLTLFDSFHRYQDNGKIATATSVTGASVNYDINSSSINCTLDQNSGSYVYRESTRVFAYQPGKSLQILQTFVLSATKANLRQRYGYFNTENGIFLQTLGTEVSFVIRSKSSGSVLENKVTRENWNVDSMDGTGPSGITLDLTKAQILFVDIEWLGVGSVRMGFVVDGVFVLCHTFHHANIVTSTYMTTACLPIRAEIENTGATISPSTMKVICSTVISEGGYEPRGRPRTIGIPINAERVLTTEGTFYPVVAIRLKSSRLDGIVLPKNIHLLGTSNTGTYQYKIVSDATVTGGSWNPIADSSVEYNITGSGMTGGTDLVSGYTTVSNQSAPVLSLDSVLFKYQLERNGLTGTAFTFVLAVAPGQNSNTCVAQLEWDEIS
jgi:hypothetical protein